MLVTVCNACVPLCQLAALRRMLCYLIVPVQPMTTAARLLIRQRPSYLVAQAAPYAPNNYAHFYSIELYRAAQQEAVMRHQPSIQTSHQ